MPSEQSGGSPKKSASGSNAANGAARPNRQIPGLESPQPQREKRPSRDDIDKVAGLLEGRKPPLEDDDPTDLNNARGRSSRNRDDDPPGRQPDPADGRSAEDQKPIDGGRRSDDDRPFLELDEEDEDGRPLKKQPKAKSILELADEHQLKHKDMYELTVPIEEGEAPMSIGQMKDRIKEVRNFEFERDDFADYRESAMNEIVESRTQIDGVIQSLKNVVEPEQLARAFADQIQRYNGQVARAKEQIREYFPEWDDPEKKSADRKKLKAALASYGFSEHEVDNVVDARLIRFAMQAIRLRERYDRAKESMREKVPSREGPSRTRQPNPNRQNQAKQLADSGDKVGAVAKLLG